MRKPTPHNGIVGVKSSNLLGSTILNRPLMLIKVNVDGLFLVSPVVNPRPYRPSDTGTRFEGLHQKWKSFGKNS
jgi:hypothetical protein